MWRDWRLCFSQAKVHARCRRSLPSTLVWYILLLVFRSLFCRCLSTGCSISKEAHSHTSARFLSCPISNVLNVCLVRRPRRLFIEFIVCILESSWGPCYSESPPPASREGICFLPLTHSHTVGSPNHHTPPIMVWVLYASPEVDRASHYPMIIVVCTVLSLLSAACVGTRLWTRHRSIGLANDDWMAALSMAFALIYGAICIARMFTRN